MYACRMIKLKVNENGLFRYAQLLDGVYKLTTRNNRYCLNLELNRDTIVWLWQLM